MVRAAVGREETRRSATKRKELRAVMGEKKKRDEDVGLSIDRKMRGKRETLHFLFSSATTKKKKRPLPSLSLLSRSSLSPSPSLSSLSLSHLSPSLFSPSKKTMQTPPSGSISSSRRCGTHEVSPCPTRTCWDCSGGRAGERALDFLFFEPFFALLSPLLSSSRPRPFLFPSIFQTMDRPTNQPTNQPTNPPTKTEKPKNQKPKTKSLLFHRIKPGV